MIMNSNDNLELHDQLTRSSDELLDLNTELSLRIRQFIQFIQKFYYPKKLTPTIREFYRHNLKEFITELETQGVVLRTNEQIKITDLFDFFKSEIARLRLEIEQKEKEIDHYFGQISQIPHPQWHSDE